MRTSCESLRFNAITSLIENLLNERIVRKNAGFFLHKVQRLSFLLPWCGFFSLSGFIITLKQSPENVQEEFIWICITKLYKTMEHLLEESFPFEIRCIKQRV